jgi:hypothetical protein
MHQKYSEPEHWRCVRFSDEVHWSVGPEGKCKIIRKLGERHCLDCIRHYLNREDKKVNVRQHSWAAIGYNLSQISNFTPPTLATERCPLRHTEIRFSSQ